MNKHTKDMNSKVYQNKKLLLGILLIFIMLISGMGVSLLWNTQRMISQAVYRQLESVREIKKSAIQDYFKERQKDMQVMIETISKLKMESLNNLTIIRDNKKKQLENYFSNCFSAMSDIQNNLRVKRGIKEFSLAFQKGIQSNSYQQVYNQYYVGLKSLKETFGFYDIFLIDALGNIIFTEKKESDLGQNLYSDDLKNTGLSKAFLKGQTSTTFVDFSWYDPSQSPAAFMSTPFMSKDNKLVGVVVFQLSSEKINRIMKERDGMAPTNEAYLVGPDYLMRSDSILDTANRSVTRSFKYPEKGKIDTIASNLAMKGQIGKNIIVDYRNQPVLSAWTPIKIGDLTWAVIVETDVSDAFSPKGDPEQYFFKKHKDIYGYYDLFLVNPDGYCFYTVIKEDDYQSNLVTGKYKDSNLGNLIQKVIQTKKFEIVDFYPYAPSSNSLAAFIAQPLLNHDKIELIVAAQLTPDAINQTMKQRSGMGETGETYLVGSDKRLRSNSFLDPEKHSVKASFEGNIENNGVDTEAVRNALAGKTGENVITDYNKNKVFSAYSPLRIGDVTWAAIAEIDVEEAFAKIHTIKWLMGIALTIASMACMIIIYLIINAGKEFPSEQEN